MSHRHNPRPHYIIKVPFIKLDYSILKRAHIQFQEMAKHVCKGDTLAKMKLLETKCWNLFLYIYHYYILKFFKKSSKNLQSLPMAFVNFASFLKIIFETIDFI